MLLKEYLSMTESVDFVFELTGEKINWSTLEELSNTNKLTPVFLFSGHVGYPVDGVTVYEKMKAYFTHDDLFMHQTRNYQSYPIGSDVIAHEWIVINSPFTIQRVIKQQMTIYKVFDEVFLFTRTIDTERGKLDAIKLSTIDFDEVRFSRNELLDLFSDKRNSANDELSQLNYENELEQADSCAQMIKSEKETNELIVAQKKIADLEQQLSQAKAELADKPAIINNDKNSYTTPAIDVMNAVIAEFWINYDTHDPAPKQNTITDWITNNFKGISNALALNIDKVCRHTSARSGGKYKR